MFIIVYFVGLGFLVEDPGVNLSGQEVIGSCDGVDVPRQMEIEVLHGDHLRIPPTGSTPCDDKGVYVTQCIIIIL